MALLTPRPRLRRALLAGLAAVALGGDGASGQDTPLPAELQVSLVTKLLSFDRSLPARAGQEVVIAVAYQMLFRPSLDLQRELLEAASGAGPVGGLPSRWVALEVGAGDGIGAALAREQVDVLYVAPLRSLPVALLIAETRARRITSVTAVPDYVAQGVALGLGLRGERPQILVNLAAAGAEGCDLNSQLLKLATLVR